MPTKVREVGKGDETIHVKRVTMDLPVELVRQLERARYRLEKAKTAIVTEALKEYFDRHRGAKTE